jgi:hypothetical protein
MKRFLTLLSLAATMGVAANAQSMDKQAFWDLVHSIPSADDLHEAYDILKRRDPSQDHLFEIAERRIANAKTNIPKVEALVKVNTSIFDYPGLIAHGEIVYIREEFFGSSGSGPCYLFTFSPSIGHQFVVTFDERGIITKVRKLDKR